MCTIVRDPTKPHAIFWRRSFSHDTFQSVSHGRWPGRSGSFQCHGRDLGKAPFPLQVDNWVDQTNTTVNTDGRSNLDTGLGSAQAVGHRDGAKALTFLKGRPPSRTIPWDRKPGLSSTQERLDWWLQHYRSLGVQHFYVIDNEHNHRLPTDVHSGGQR